MRHRRLGHRRLVWLAPFAGALAIATFPAVAGAGPLPPPSPLPTCSPTPTVPCNTALPTILPANEVASPPEGRILHATPGTWVGTASITYAFQWEWCDGIPTPIGHAINSTYAIASTDVGHMLCVVVTARNSAGRTSATSAPTGVVTIGTPLDRAAPTVSGLAQDGQTLTGGPGTWAGTAPITYGYQWRRCDRTGAKCGAAFPATPSASPTYVLQDIDVGHTMQVLVTATNAAGKTTAGAKTSTAVVTPGNTAVPTISGTAQQGKTLTESHGSWLPTAPTGFAYQWEHCNPSGAACSAIPGATSQTYGLTASDVGHTLRVEESASSAGVTGSPATSAATGVVQPPVAHPKVSSAKIRRLLLNALAVHGKGVKIGALLKHGGFSFVFAAPSPGRLVISWYQTARHGKKVLVAGLTVVFHKAGTARIKLVLTGKGRRLLKGASNLKLTAQGGFTPVGQGTTGATKSLTLKR